ncbi:MAG: nucleotidyl transferase AbiEii/AbiGii toxin family protein [Candidatus Margulisiibacteriota bacterium]|nr:nucleotidyl transferase AbiEii/AbiGii toxin family protein [Candidatus Margulisiibacteriota bacterium]
MFEKLIEKIAKALGKTDIPYMIIGGQAVLLYGEPRLTRDIDITLGIGTDKLSLILDILKILKLHPLPDNPVDFAKKTWVLPSQDKKSKIRIDFIFSFTPFEQQAIENAKKIRIGKTKVNFASPEDVIIHKIFAGRARDIEDVKSILIKNPSIDINYIQKWLRDFENISPEKNLLKIFKDCLEK